jgi:hypothetical protein
VNLPIQHQEVLDRLSKHGIKPENYIEIKRIVSFDIPHGLLLFAQRFGHRSIKEVLAQVAHWREFLESDTLLTDDEKRTVARVLEGVELVVCQALMDANLLNIGPWVMRAEYLPTAHDEKGKAIYIRPGTRVTAENRKTGARRSVHIAGEESNDTAKRIGAWKLALEELGIWDLVDRGTIYPSVMRGGRPRGWPTFTKFVIPRLYEHLAPHYQHPGHYSEKRDMLKTRKALYPRELLEDMLLILRFEHPGTFEDMTFRQVKADIQHYVEQNHRRGTKTPK